MATAWLMAWIRSSAHRKSAPAPSPGTGDVATLTSTWGFAFELVFAAIVVATPVAGPLSMALPSWDALLLLLPFPLVVWGADELWRARRRNGTVARRA